MGTSISSRFMPLLAILISSTLLLIVSCTPVSKTKPVLVVLPAAWHLPIHYGPYEDQLRSAGYSVASERLPSCNSANPRLQSVANDAAFFRERLIMPYINSGREVVVIMHSYSGGPGAMAAKGLSVAERQATGKLGGVIGLIFVSAWIAQEGETFTTGSGGRLSPWVIENPDGQTSVRNPKEIFYNDVPVSVAKWAIQNLGDEARAAAFTPSGPPAWNDIYYNGRRAYAKSSKDNALPLWAQQAMLTASGVEWDVEVFATGHVAFLSQPKLLSKWTDQQVQKFQVLGVAGGGVAVA